MNAIDLIAHTNAWSDRHPGEKVLLGGSLLLLSLILPPWPGAVLIIAAVSFLAILGARVPASAFLRILALPLAFLVSGALMLALSLDLEGGAPMLRVTGDSVETGVRVSLRALAATSATMLIVLTTPLPALIHLSRRLRLPEPLIELAFLIYRFTGLTIGLAATGRQAQRNRLGDRDLASSLRATGLLAASLLPRTLVRAQRLQVGLVARGYDGRMQTLAPAWRLSRRFAAASSVLAAAIALAAWGSRGLSP